MMYNSTFLINFFYNIGIFIIISCIEFIIFFCMLKFSEQEPIIVLFIDFLKIFIEALFISFLFLILSIYFKARIGLSKPIYFSLIFEHVYAWMLFLSLLFISALKYKNFDKYKYYYLFLGLIGMSVFLSFIKY